MPLAAQELKRDPTGRSCRAVVQRHRQHDAQLLRSADLVLVVPGETIGDACGQLVLTGRDQVLEVGLGLFHHGVRQVMKMPRLRREADRGKQLIVFVEDQDVIHQGLRVEVDTIASERLGRLHKGLQDLVF